MGVLLQDDQKIQSKQPFDITTEDWVDDFGREFITLDPTNGRYVDSFGNPLIRGADEEQVASFREIRNLSKATWTMINNHRKEKERKEILRRSNLVSIQNHENILHTLHPPNKHNDEDDLIPSFLQHS
jgi:hypothetical protein